MATEKLSYAEGKTRDFITDEYGYQVPAPVLSSNYETVAETWSAMLDREFEPIEVSMLVTVLVESGEYRLKD